MNIKNKIMFILYTVLKNEDNSYDCALSGFTKIKDLESEIPEHINYLSDGKLSHFYGASIPNIVENSGIFEGSEEDFIQIIGELKEKYGEDVFNNYEPRIDHKAIEGKFIDASGNVIKKTILTNGKIKEESLGSICGEYNMDIDTFINYVKEKF